MTIAEGTLIAGRFRVDARLGEGGMGTVYRALDVATGEARAIKVLKDRAEEESRKRFLREGRTAAMIRHPNVVRVFDVLDDPNDVPAIVMEYLPGESLAERLHREIVLTVAETARIVAAACEGLAAAHALGVVHRDLKPENVFLTMADGPSHVKIVDFGIAKLTALEVDAKRTAGLTTATGMLLGTPAFMSPEQIFGEKDIDGRTDIWALGLILYQCMSGVLPTYADSLGQMLKTILDGAIVPLELIAPTLPKELCELIDRMLARRRRDRPKSVDDVRAALEPFVACDLPRVEPRATSQRYRETLKSGAPRGTDPHGRTIADSTRTPRPTVVIPDDAPLDVLETARAVAREPARPPRRFARMFGAAIVAAALGGSGLMASRFHGAGTASTHASATNTGSSAVAAADGVIVACPIFEAPERSSWLGAAAADLACRRARWFAGDFDRASGPAELLDLPRTPVTTFPGDALGAADARAKTLEHAKSCAEVVLDGRVEAIGSEVALTLIARAPDGTERGRASARGPALPELATKLVVDLADRGAIPVRAPSSTFTRWMRIDDRRTGVGIEDLASDSAEIDADCAALAPAVDRLGVWGKAVRVACGETAPLDLDRTSTETLALSVFAFVMTHDAPLPPTIAGELESARAKESSRYGRAQLALGEAYAVMSTSPDRARELALAAITEEPREPDAWFMLSRVGTTTDLGFARAAAAWDPGTSHNWIRLGDAAGDPAERIGFYERAFALVSVGRTATPLASALRATGSVEDLRVVAAKTRGTHYRDERARDLVLAWAEQKESRPRAAFDRLVRAMGASDHWMDGRVTTELAASLLDLGEGLGDARAIADAWYRGVVSGAPERLALAPAAMPYDADAIAIALCLAGAKETREPCLDGLEKPRGGAVAGWTRTSRAMLDGARLWIRGDAKKAVEAFRPVLATSAAKWLPVDAFDAAGELDLADSLDDALRKSPADLRARLAAARSAKRALQRGDHDRARALAGDVVRSLERADAALPVVAEMRALRARL